MLTNVIDWADWIILVRQQYVMMIRHADIFRMCGGELKQPKRSPINLILPSTNILPLIFRYEHHPPRAISKVMFDFLSI